jgi:transglutaminase-like putative cysteine protease
MTWRLSIEHVTEYDYAGKVLASYNEARISPQRDASQLVLDHAIGVQPASPMHRYVDYWGTDVCAFDVHEPHSRLVVTGVSLVETRCPRTIRDPVDWARLRTSDVSDDLYEFVSTSSYVDCNANVDAAGSDIASASKTPLDAVHSALAWTREKLAYSVGATDVSTTATEALALGQGVCQDFVHLALAVLRAIGIPARYASGYLHPHADGTQGETVVGQSHAWLEAWVGDWYAFDPTNGADVGPRHVLVARGRDYGDVVPLKGVFHGPPSASHEVRVAITRVA